VLGNNAVRTCKGLRFRAATLPIGRAATRVAEFSLALPFGETTCNRPDTDLESDSADNTDVDRPAAPVDFPGLPGLADELPDSADAAGGLGKGLRFRAATVPAGRAAARVAEFSLALSFGETTRNRSDADFESDSVDATDVDRPFPGLPGLADELPDSADAAGGLVFGRRVAPSVLGNNAVRTCKGLRFRAATLPIGRAAARVAEAFRQSAIA
jgi:hypothetical protein